MNTRNPSHARSITALWLLALVLVVAGRALAVVPSTVSYQGYLTNPDGSPVEVTTDITFRLYNVDAGGVPGWEDTLSVTVDKGLFSVELGAGSPFPLGLFDNPLWLGIDVENDGEMSPRRPFDSVAFAFKADDALTLEGQGAASLDQSAHVTEFDNPHAVTAAQTGALSGTALTTHAAEATAHHSRYADSEAVDAIKAADGPDSGLDADLLDGNHAMAFAPTGHTHNASYYTQGQVDTLLASLRDELQTRIEDLEKILAKVSVSSDGNQIYVTGANLHLRSGSGATAGVVNGLGNLIVGYDETRTKASCSLGAYYANQTVCENDDGQWWVSEKSGSHNLVVGSEHNYSSFGGLVVGSSNTISSEFASVSGGQGNTASGQKASVSGGVFNTAGGVLASVSGGLSNNASGWKASVSGGFNNTARGIDASVSGGFGNIASGLEASVSGGWGNTASGDFASVSGGQNNTASGNHSSVAGGGASISANGNHAYANYSAILGGIKNTTGDPVSGDHALGERSTVSGGDTNFAKGLSSTVSGGVGNFALGYRSAISGGSANATSSEASTVSGGANNSATGDWSVVSGGLSNGAAADYSWCAAGLGNCAP